MITDIIDWLIGMHADYFKPGVAAFCELETAETEYARPGGPLTLTNDLVASDGSYVTILALRGKMTLSDQTDLQASIKGLSIGLRSFFAKHGHAMQIVFSRDPSKGEQRVRSLLHGMRRAAEAKGLDIDDILEARQRLYSSRIVQEDIYLALWSRPSLLAPTQGAERKAKKEAREKDAPSMQGGQNILLGEEMIYSLHRNFVKTTYNLFSGLEFVVEELDAHSAVRAVKGSVYPDQDLVHWRPRLPLDKVTPYAVDGLGTNNISGAMCPPLADQIFSRVTPKSPVDKYRIAEIGDLIFRSFDMTLAPENLTAFDGLVRSVEASAPEMAWRISFLIEMGSQQALFWKHLASLILWIFNKSQNGRVRDATAYLQQYASTDTPVLGMRVNLATWAKKGQERMLADRALTLLSCFEQWGGAQAGEIAGDPHQSTLSSALGLAVASTAKTAYPPIEDGLAMLPLTRPAPAFKSGSVLYRTPDGIPMPYAPGSSELPAHLELHYAPPRSGKSVNLSTINMGAATQATKDQYGAKLPLQVILDIGPSARGYISVLQDALPANRRHEALYKKPQNHEADGINVFDTQLGNRKPLPMEASFIENFLCQLCTAAGDSGEASLSGVLSRAVELCYLRGSDGFEEKKYTPNRDTAVDEWIAAQGFAVDSHTTWWEVVDYLHEQGEYKLAASAQRFAVPVMNDLIFALRDPAITSTYGKINTRSGTPLLEFVKIRLSEAISRYPILKGHTQFDLANARVVALNLEDICPPGSGPASHQRSVMYMLCRYIGARSYFIADSEGETLQFYNPQYQDYHRARLLELAETPKRLVFDEFHRTAGATYLREQLMLDVREGPKYNVQIALSSQMMADFSPEIVENATAVFIMRAGQGQNVIDDLCKTFGLNAMARHILEHHLHNMGQFLAFFVTKKGKFLQHMVNDVAPLELWAYSTTPEDMALRARLTKLVGPKRARALLAARYPSGTAKPDVERRIESDRSGDGKAASNLYEEMAEEILRAERMVA